MIRQERNNQWRHVHKRARKGWGRDEENGKISCPSKGKTCISLLLSNIFGPIGFTLHTYIDLDQLWVNLSFKFACSW